MVRIQPSKKTITNGKTKGKTNENNKGRGGRGGLGVEIVDNMHFVCILYGESHQSRYTTGPFQDKIQNPAFENFKSSDEENIIQKS